MTAPRWQDVRLVARDAVVSMMMQARAESALYVDSGDKGQRKRARMVVEAIDAALARLAEPERSAEPVREVAASEHPCARRCWRIGAPAEIVDGVCAECSSPGRKREPTAAERWRAVPERGRRIIVDDLTARAENEDGGAYALRNHPAASASRREVAEAVRALLALAHEAEGGGV